MKTTIRTKLHAALLCIGAAAAALPVSVTSALAADDAPPTRTVRFADLDISKPAGAKVLYQRIKAAARQVCELPYVSDRHLLGVQQTCINKAIDDAVDNVGSPALSELHASKALRLASR